MRVDGSKGSSVTLQFYQETVGLENAPWDKKTGRNLRKDQFYIAISNVPENFDHARVEKCFEIISGVLPLGYSDEQDWTECAANQKNAGY